MFLKLLFVFLIIFQNVDSKSITGKEISILLSNWLTERDIKSDFKILSEIKYPACDDLLVNSISVNHSLIKISCYAPKNWSFIVRNKVIQNTYNKKIKKTTKKSLGVKKKPNTHMHEVAVLLNTLRKGEIIHNDNIVVKNKRIRDIDNYLIKSSDLIGKKVRRTISSDKPIHYKAIEKEWMIEKNSEVIVENDIGILNIKVKGVALHDADFMEKVKVKNVSSGEIITGFVENKKKVLIRPKQF